MPISLSDEEFESLRQLLKIVTDNNLSELSVTLSDEVEVTIKTTPPQGFIPVAHGYPPPLLAASGSGLIQTHPSSVPSAETALPQRKGIPVTAPMVGIYYHSPTPEDPPYVKVGDVIRVGQTIGLIEAMKVFSEVPSEAAGRVTEIAAENGALVQLGQPLFYLEPV